MSLCFYLPCFHVSNSALLLPSISVFYFSEFVVLTLRTAIIMSMQIYVTHSDDEI